MALRAFLLCGSLAFIAGAAPAAAQGSSNFLASLAAMPRSVAGATTPVAATPVAMASQAVLKPVAPPRPIARVMNHRGHTSVRSAWPSRSAVARQIAEQQAQIAVLTAKVDALSRQVAPAEPQPRAALSNEVDAQFAGIRVAAPATADVEGDAPAKRGVTMTALLNLVSL